MEKYKSADVATNFWATKISQPATFDNGDYSLAGLKTSMLAYTMLGGQNRPSLSEEQIDNFKQLLSNTIEEQLDARGFCSLEVDYEPQGILYQVADEAGIDRSLFPWKTMMDITEYYVKVSELGREYQFIYPVKQKIK